MLIKIFLLENGGTTCKIVETQIRSDLGLHFFANTPLGVSSMKWVKDNSEIVFLISQRKRML